MCGVAGIWTRGPARDADAVAMADALAHRGPDDGGVWSDPNAGIALSHRRLSIIDLSPAGHQPMASPCGRFILSFNGEIYNHLAIRAELERVGPVAWRGYSDTETLVCAIARWGLVATLGRVVGMFALAVWDRERRELALARDRIGEKPLYYGWSNGAILFGSELKALRAVGDFEGRICPAAVALYLRHNVVPAPRSILRDVFKVEPGVIVTLGAEALGVPPASVPSVSDKAWSKGVSIERYWSLDALVAAGVDERMTAAEAIAGLRVTLRDAVAQQMVADTTLGAFLSGGVDSSAIVALMREVAGSRVRTFTIGFAEPGYDEAPYARAVARHLGTDHSELYVDAGAVRAIIPDLPRIYDEPFADSSQLPMVLLSRFARQTVTVALSGDGGDELFCGYNRYLVSDRHWSSLALLPLPLRRALGRWIRRVPPARWDAMSLLPGLSRISMPGAKAHKIGRMLGTPLGAGDIYRSASEEWQEGLPMMLVDAPPEAAWPELRSAGEEQMMHRDMAGYLPNDILTKVDRAAMACGLETRMPFLDHRVVEQAWRIPLAFKKRGGQGKWLLRQVLYRQVPAALIERPKAGFAIPVGAWLRGPLRDWAEHLLDPRELDQEGLLDATAVRARWAEHLRGSHDWTGSLWSVLMLRAWAAAY